jgi:thiamine-phosphate pyrophosphorylase
MPQGLDVFYPIVPDIGWMRRLVPLGVRTIQLRLKDASEAEVRRQILESLDICIRHGCQLVVNDYWREAIAAGADYIHLGQEDLAAADIPTIKAAGIKLGISTHNEELKVMKFGPQGLDRVRQWKDRIGATPLCAIGGITPDRAPGVVAAGADTVAVITDFFTHADPEARVRQWLAWADKTRSD